jgi:hypothetical protein
MAPRIPSGRLRRRKVRIPRIPKTRQPAVTRAELNRVIELLNQRGKMIEGHGELLAIVRHDLDLQFRRIAQIQAELDQIKRREKLNLT